ncbi:sarcosine oxidase subunit gamma [Pacificoceanicola onchidii]|uniref:sarcosine oxidase subunit gamma n=1 Tax=Pacificoceanicola onchidii TaxID=2562685 RepID=UPI0010A3C183|nr:sarcosine oxidase subunit gamma [Pacificoceanicola onchidii]
MHDFVEITPLGGGAPRVQEINGIVLSEVTDRALASVAARLGQEDEAKALVSGFIEAPAPDAGRLSGSAKSAFWTGPDQWMVEAPIETHEDLAAELSEKAASRASVTEQTDGWCRFDLEGGDLVAVFEILCPVDLRKGQKGDATRTSIDHLGCFVLRRETDLVSVIGPRSSAGSLFHALETAVRAVR